MNGNLKAAIPAMIRIAEPITCDGREMMSGAGSVRRAGEGSDGLREGSIRAAPECENK
jgi:hypothetical protein